MLVHEVRLHPPRNVLGKDDVEAATKPQEPGGVRLLPGGRQFLHDAGGEEITGSRLWRRGLVDRSGKHGAEKQGGVRKVAIRQLRADGESLGARMGRYGQGVRLGKQPSADQLAELPTELLLQRRRQQAWRE